MNETIMALLLEGIKRNDMNYPARAVFIYKALALASTLDYPAGIRFDPDEPHWPVVFIQLPTGQVSWHMDEHPTAWDGHTTEEKYRRIDQYVRGYIT